MGCVAALFGELVKSMRLQFPEESMRSIKQSSAQFGLRNSEGIEV